MKRIGWLLGFIVFLTGCSKENQELRTVMEFRDAFLSAESSHFQSDITADYGDFLHTFSMDCHTDAAGNLSFQITQPDSIAGIKGTISNSGGNITFEDQSLYFPLMADDLLTPASAPWIFVKTLRSGYITSVCTEDEFLHVTMDDSYAEDALSLDIWMDGACKPVRAEILHDGSRILTLEVNNFVFS